MAATSFAGETAPDDIVSDTIARLRLRFPDISVQDFVEVEDEIRHDWGGDRPYVCKSGESGRIERTKREQSIRAEHRGGEHVGVLARRWGLSIRRIQQIVKG